MAEVKMNMKRARPWLLGVLGVCAVLAAGAAGQPVSRQEFDALEKRLSAIEQRLGKLEHLMVAFHAQEIRAWQKPAPEKPAPLPPSLVYSGVGRGHWVKKVMDNGRMVVLEDGSLWEVGILDRIDAALWLPLSGITVLENPSGFLPYRLVNTDDGEVVEAKYIGRQ